MERNEKGSKMKIYLTLASVCIVLITATNAWAPPFPPSISEPATFIIFGLGLLGLAGMSRKRK